LLSLLQVYLELADGQGWAAAYNFRTGALLAANLSPRLGDVDENYFVASQRDISEVEVRALDKAAELIEMDIYSRLPPSERKDVRLNVRKRFIQLKRPMLFPVGDRAGLCIPEEASELLSQVGRLIELLVVVASEWDLEQPRVEIQSHSHRKNKQLEDEEDHIKLTHARAAAVMLALTDSGVPAKPLFCNGYGTSCPVDRSRPWLLCQRIDFRILLPSSWGEALARRLGLTGDAPDPMFQDLLTRLRHIDVPHDCGVVIESDPPRLFTSTSAVEKFIVLREGPSLSSKLTGARLHRDEFFDVDKRWSNGKTGKKKEVWLRLADRSGWFSQFHARSRAKLAIDFVALGGEAAVAVRNARNESAARRVKFSLYGGLLSNKFSQPIDDDDVRGQSSEVKDILRQSPPKQPTGGGFRVGNDGNGPFSAFKMPDLPFETPKLPEFGFEPPTLPEFDFEPPKLPEFDFKPPKLPEVFNVPWVL
jgi:hypothetical protein